MLPLTGQAICLATTVGWRDWVICRVKPRNETVNKNTKERELFQGYTYKYIYYIESICSREKKSIAWRPIFCDGCHFWRTGIPTKYQSILKFCRQQKPSIIQVVCEIPRALNKSKFHATLASWPSLFAGLGIIDNIGEFNDLCVVTVNLSPRFGSSNKHRGYHRRNNAQLVGGFNPISKISCS